MSITQLARPEIAALKPYASARALADSAGILLNANENPWAPPGDSGLALNRYPDPQPADLKARLADYYGVPSEQLLITRGSDEGIDLLVRTFCRAGRDQVLTCPPCFGMYAISARIQGAEVVEVPLVDAGSDFEADFDAVEQAGPCKLYFLCSPNNPTGNLLAAEAVITLADAVSDHGLVVVDEAYLEFTGAPSLASSINGHPNLVVLRTLSKALALAGCRMGVVIADPEIIGLIGRIIPPYPIATPAVAAARTALASDALALGEQRTRQLMQDKERLVDSLDSHPAIERLWPGEANFVLVRTADGPGLVEAASRARIRLRDQSAQPGLADCVRITVGTPAENDALIDFLQGWQS